MPLTTDQKQPLIADYRINEMWQLYGRVENLMNRKYEEVYTIRSSGVAFYAGLRATLQ